MSELDRRGFMMQAAGALAAVSIFPSVLPAGVRREGEGLGVALVGAGRQGRAILGELAKIEAVKVVAVCDSDAQRLEAVGRRVQGAESFADHRAMLEKRTDVSAVIVATPTHLHRGVALDALSAGKHVYCEAPLAHTVEDCRAIAAAARGSKTVFMPGLEGRCNPVYQLARGFARSEAMRDMIAVRAQQSQKTSWRVPASDPARDKALNWRLDPEVSIGLIGELGVQAIDVAHWYRGSFPVSAWGAGSVRFHQDGRSVFDTVVADLAFEDGVRMGYSATLANSFEGRYELFQGSNSAIKLAWSHGWMFKEADAPTQGWEVYANRQQFHNDEGITLIADATKLAEQGKLKEGVGLPHPSLYYALNAFFTAVIDGKAPPVTAEDGLRATAVAILAHQASLKGERLSITPETLKA